jgi:hypothetical protein
VGLTGPAFVEGPPRPDHRFVNFCRMFGRAAEVQQLGGGTWGYGKGQYFLMSGAATIIVHTRSRERGGLLERLLGVSLWNANPDGIETGRHWWGIEQRPGLVGPAEGENAARVAASVGFRPFTRDETGTSIMIVAPRFESVAWDAAGRCIAESMAIWFWPRMLGGVDELGTLSFEVACNGHAIAVPDPTRVAPLRLYADALRNLRKRAATRREIPLPAIVREVRSERPKARLGWLSLAKAARQERDRFAVSRIDDHPFGDQLVGDGADPGCTHHVALMRGPGQVIRYLRCRAYPEETMEYAGVFLADSDSAEVNEAFARAEPPSHDDWTFDDLPDQQKRYVRAALRDIATSTEMFADAGKPDATAVEQDPLGAISAELGELMSAPGTGARRQPKKPGAGGGARVTDAHLELLGSGELKVVEGRVVLAVPFRITTVADVTASIGAKTRVVVAGGGAEAEAPAGGAQPRLLEWRDSANGVVRQPVLRVEAPEGAGWEVIVEVPGDAMVGVTLELL